MIQPASIGPHAHKIPGRFNPHPTNPSKGGLEHDDSIENDIGVERNTLTGSTQTTGTGIESETAPVHVAEMLCIRHD